MNETDAETRTGHTLSVKLDMDTACVAVECHEGPDADCHKVCKTCDEVCYCGPDKQLETVKFCNLSEWANADDAAACFVGKSPLPLVDGMAVEIKWQPGQDYYGWDVSS